MVTKQFGIEKSIGIGIGKIWYRKKFHIWFWVLSHTDFNGDDFDDGFNDDFDEEIPLHPYIDTPCHLPTWTAPPYNWTRSNLIFSSLELSLL